MSIATHIQVSIVNEDEGWRIYDEMEPNESELTNGEIYRFALREYGRCLGRVYVDHKDGIRPVGWTFLKLARYEDTGEPYRQVTWIVPSVKIEDARPALYDYAT